MHWQDGTRQVTAEQQERCVVEVGPHTLAEESWDWVCSVGGVPLLFSTLLPSFGHWEQSCWAYPWFLEMETQICLVLEAFLLSSGNLELCLHPQAHLLTCQRWGNSFSPTYCLLEGVRFNLDSLGTWPGSYPHTKTSDLILGLWLSFHLATAPSDKCMIQRRSCHPAVCPYGTTGKTTPAFYQCFKLMCWPVKLRCWEHPLPPCSTGCNCCWRRAAST